LPLQCRLSSRLGDLMQYKEARMRASEAAMAELARQAQELGMGYE